MSEMTQILRNLSNPKTKHLRGLNININELDLDNIDHLMVGQLYEIKCLIAELLKEVRSRSDEGMRAIYAGPVQTNVFTIIDTELLTEDQIEGEEHSKVKGYKIENTGKNPLAFSHNAALSSVGPSPEDVAEALGGSQIGTPTLFEILEPGGEVEVNYNKNVIKNIWMLALGGPTNHETTLVR